jgi:hypothetical protein
MDDSMARLRAALSKMSITELRLVLRFAEFLKTQQGG